jgi:hypothetical protein
VNKPKAMLVISVCGVLALAYIYCRDAIETSVIRHQIGGEIHLGSTETSVENYLGKNDLYYTVDRTNPTIVQDRQVLQYLHNGCTIDAHFKSWYLYGWGRNILIQFVFENNKLEHWSVIVRNDSL